MPSGACESSSASAIGASLPPITVTSSAPLPTFSIIAFRVDSVSPQATIEKVGEGAELVTVIGGSDAPIALAELDSHAPAGVELELQDGGQPYYWWLLAAQ